MPFELGRRLRVSPILSSRSTPLTAHVACAPRPSYPVSFEVRPRATIHFVSKVPAGGGMCSFPKRLIR